MILPLMLTASIYNDGEEVTSGRRLVIMDNGGRLSALKKESHDGEEQRSVIKGKLGQLEVSYQRKVRVFGGY